MRMVPSSKYTSIAATAAGYTTWGGYLTSSNSVQYKDNSIHEKAAFPSDAAFFVVSGPELDPEKLLTNPNTMNKLNQFSGRGAYVQPYCKAVTLQSRDTILSGSNYGDTGDAGGQGGWREDDGEDY